jgi:hypothetical protein
MIWWTGTLRSYAYQVLMGVAGMLRTLFSLAADSLVLLLAKVL